MQATNLISNGSTTVRARQLPFNNNFTQQQYIKTCRTSNGRDAYVVVVKCTSDSREPGRLYACTYSAKGTLLDCNTLN